MADEVYKEPFFFPINFGKVVKEFVSSLFLISEIGVLCKHKQAKVYVAVLLAHVELILTEVYPKNINREFT